MKSMSIASSGVFAACVAVLWALAADVSAQDRARSNTPAANKAPAPQRLRWGDPDLQGLWTNTTTTPLERLQEASDKTVLSEEERLSLAQQRMVRGLSQVGVDDQNRLLVSRQHRRQ